MMCRAYILGGAMALLPLALLAIGLSVEQRRRDVKRMHHVRRGIGNVA